MDSLDLNKNRDPMKGRIIDLELATDKEAAKKYNDLITDVYNEPELKYTASNGNKVSLLTFDRKLIAKKLAGCPQAEVDRIKALHESIAVKMQQAGVLKRKALGVIGGRKDEAGHYNNILTPIKSQVVDWFGRLHSKYEIQRMLADRGYPVSVSKLEAFYTQHKEEIEKQQIAYEKDWKSVTVSRKRNRLDQLSYMYHKVKQEYDSTNGTKQLQYTREMRAILEQVRKEVEGDNIHLTVDGYIDVNMTIEANKTTEELYASINFMSLLIGRVSARFNLNPIVLHSRLLNSWYAEHTGIKRNDRMHELQPQYPSAIIYNWDTMRDKHEQRKQFYDKMAENAEHEIVDGDEMGYRKKNMKELMLEKMKMLEKRVITS